MCPECGSPVKHSAMGDELRYANTKWLYKVRVGLLIMASVTLVGFIYRLAQLTLIDRNMFRFIDDGTRAIVVFSWIGLITADVIGVWLFVAAEPGREGRGWLRRFIHLAVTTGGALISVGMILESFNIVLLSTQTWFLLYVFLRIPGFILFATGAVGCLWVMHVLARRTRARVLAGSIWVLLVFDVLESLINAAGLVVTTFLILESASAQPNWRLYDAWELVESVEMCYFWLPRLFWIIVLLSLFFKLKGAHDAARKLLGEDLENGINKNRPADVGGTSVGP